MINNHGLIETSLKAFNYWILWILHYCGCGSQTEYLSVTPLYQAITHISCKLSPQFLHYYPTLYQCSSIYKKAWLFYPKVLIIRSKIRWEDSQKSHRQSNLGTNWKVGQKSSFYHFGLIQMIWIIILPLHTALGDDTNSNLLISSVFRQWRYFRRRLRVGKMPFFYFLDWCLLSAVFNILSFGWKIELY